MRVLLDENLPRKLKRHFDEGVEALTVRDCGWTGIKNGELLRIAQAEFDVFITTDKGIPTNRIYLCSPLQSSYLKLKATALKIYQYYCHN
jgi:predicted nuclease of predicted toxin-antitoxin system